MHLFLLAVVFLQTRLSVTLSTFLTPDLDTPPAICNCICGMNSAAMMDFDSRLSTLDSQLSTLLKVIHKNHRGIKRRFFCIPDLHGDIDLGL